MVILLGLTTALSGCAQGNEPNSEIQSTNNVDKSVETSPTNIKTNDIYKMHIIGQKIKSVGLSSIDRKNLHVNLGILTDHKDHISFSFILSYRKSNNKLSSTSMLATPSLIDKRILCDYPKSDKVDINNVVVIYFEQKYLEGGPRETGPKIVAYSKVVDMQKRANNISEITIYGANAKTSDIIADVVTVIKDGNGYKLVSNAMSFVVEGDLPEEMKRHAIEQPKDEFPVVGIENLFVAYMSFTDLAQLEDEDCDYKVKVITYSPVTGGEPVNMDKQGLQ